MPLFLGAMLHAEPSTPQTIHHQQKKNEPPGQTIIPWPNALTMEHMHAQSIVKLVVCTTTTTFLGAMLHAEPSTQRTIHHQNKQKSEPSIFFFLIEPSFWLVWYIRPRQPQEHTPRCMALVPKCEPSPALVPKCKPSPALVSECKPSPALVS